MSQIRIYTKKNVIHINMRLLEKWVKHDGSNMCTTRIIIHFRCLYMCIYLFIFFCSLTFYTSCHFLYIPSHFVHWIFKIRAKNLSLSLFFAQMIVPNTDMRAQDITVTVHKSVARLSVEVNCQKVWGKYVYILKSSAAFGWNRAHEFTHTSAHSFAAIP